MGGRAQRSRDREVRESRAGPDFSMDQRTSCLAQETIAMLPLEGKAAVITGGTSGIGARTAEVFVANGARIVIAGRRQDRGEKLAGKLGDAASFIPTDVSI